MWRISMGVCMLMKYMVKDHKKVKFSFYRDKELWYITEDGFEFPVPIQDTGNATFMSEDRAILFMRYIRKHLETIEQAKKEQNLAIV
jgi:hypothetical protein